MGIKSVNNTDFGAFEQPGGVDRGAHSEELAALSLRCVECDALYPGFEEEPRYRCECGGVLDVEAPFQLPASHRTSSGLPAGSAERDMLPLAGAAWRQLFDERASAPPIWPLGAPGLLADRSGVWRYRELILPVPEDMIVSRPEGNTGLYPVEI